MLYRQIILEWGQDTESGVWGLGYSPDNGKNFYVLNTTHGRKYRAEDGNRLYPYISDQVQDKIETVVAPAKSAADSAVAYANDAIDKSRVNSQAIDDINSAVSDAASDAAVARSDGLRAWDAAQSNVNLIDLSYASASAEISSARTEAIAAADEAKKSASAAQADIATVRSDVAAAKSGIAITKSNLASQATSLSSYAAQASAAGKDITTLKSQAGQFEQDMASTKGDVSQLKVSASSVSATLSDAAGNISRLQITAKSYSMALSDANSNIASVTATARELKTKYADAAGDINKLEINAKGMTQTLADAKGDIAKLKTRADGIDAKYANVAGDINKFKIDASGMKQTLIDAKGNISTLQSTATGFKNTLSDAQGNISTLQSDVSGLKKTTSDNAGNISTLQSTANTLTSQMSSAQGDISTLKQTASGFSSKVSGMEKSLADANNRLDNLKVGTSNLLHHSDTFDGWYKGNSVTVTSDKYLNGTIAVLGNTGLGGGSMINAALDGPYDNQPVTWTVYAKADNAGDKLHTELWGGGGYTDQPLTNNWQIYQFTGQRNFAHPEFYLWGYQGNKGNIYVSLPFAVVGNAIGTWEPNSADIADKITANTTAIDQNRKAITLKADQTTVDKTNGTVQQLQSQLKVQADQINSKVSSSDLDAKGYATQEYTRSLVTQKADSWNLNLTTLKTDVNAIKTNGGGVNLLAGTRDFKQFGYLSKVAVTNGQDQFQAVTGMFNSGGSYYDIVCFGNLPLKKDTDYTASFWVKTSENVDIVSFLFDSGSNGNYSDGATVNHATTDYTRVVVHFHNGNNNATPNFIPVRILKTGVTVWLYGCMLEEGTIAHTWSPAPSDMATVTSVTNLSATVDGIQAQVYNKDGSSKITQLSGLIATKVSSGDFTSTTTQLKNLINQRVQVGDVISQINQEAGGDTLIQVSNGKKSLILDAGNTIVTGKAWIPVAAIADLTADQIKAGTLKGVKVDFRDSTGTGMTADGSTLTFDVNNTPAGYMSYNGMPIAELPDGSGGNEFSIRYRMSTSILPDDSSGAQATFSKAAQKIAYMTGTNQGRQMLSGLEVHSNNHHWLGAVNSDATYNRIEINSNDGVNLAWHDNTHFWISDGKAKLYKDYDDGQTATKLEVHGWAWVNGWVEAAGHSQHSTLSSKTRIEEADPNHMLDLVNNTELTTFSFKSEVAEGTEARHIGPIIDDVNDVAQYQMPAEFIAPTKTARDDDNMIGALFGAVQALTKRIKTLESKAN